MPPRNLAQVYAARSERGGKRKSRYAKTAAGLPRVFSSRTSLQHSAPRWVPALPAVLSPAVLSPRSRLPGFPEAVLSVAARIEQANDTFLGTPPTSSHSQESRSAILTWELGGTAAMPPPGSAPARRGRRRPFTVVRAELMQCMQDEAEGGSSSSGNWGRQIGSKDYDRTADGTSVPDIIPPIAGGVVAHDELKGLRERTAQIRCKTFKLLQRIEDDERHFSSRAPSSAPEGGITRCWLGVPVPPTLQKQQQQPQPEQQEEEEEEEEEEQQQQQRQGGEEPQKQLQQKEEGEQLQMQQAEVPLFGQVQQVQRVISLPTALHRTSFAREEVERSDAEDESEASPSTAQTPSAASRQTSMRRLMRSRTVSISSALRDGADSSKSPRSSLHRTSLAERTRRPSAVRFRTQRSKSTTSIGARSEASVKSSRASRNASGSSSSTESSDESSDFSSCSSIHFKGARPAPRTRRSKSQVNISFTAPRRSFAAHARALQGLTQRRRRTAMVAALATIMQSDGGNPAKKGERKLLEVSRRFIMDLKPVSVLLSVFLNRNSGELRIVGMQILSRETMEMRIGERHVDALFKHCLEATSRDVHAAPASGPGAPATSFTGSPANNIEKVSCEALIEALEVVLDPATGKPSMHIPNFDPEAEEERPDPTLEMLTPFKGLWRSRLSVAGGQQ